MIHPTYKHFKIFIVRERDREREGERERVLIEHYIINFVTKKK